MDTKKLLAISKKARQERKQEKEKRRQEKLQAVENEEEIVEEMLKNQPIKVREKQETGSASEGNDGQIVYLNKKKIKNQNIDKKY